MAGSVYKVIELVDDPDSWERPLYGHRDSGGHTRDIRVAEVGRWMCGWTRTRSWSSEKVHVLVHVSQGLSDEARLAPRVEGRAADANASRPSHVRSRFYDPTGQLNRFTLASSPRPDRPPRPCFLRRAALPSDPRYHGEGATTNFSPAHGRCR